MSRSQSEERIALIVEAADGLTEVFLVDSQFKRVAAGIGRLEAKVRPGLYKARFRSGQTQTDSLIEVEAGSSGKVFAGAAVEFATAAPLPKTESSRKEHEEAARALSKAASVRKGSGSGIYLFCRGLTSEASQPWLGVSLHDADGSLLADAGQGTCDAGRGIFALNVEVDPGSYRLRVEEEPGEIYEMFVVALAGWQTQVLAVANNYWLPGIQACRAALPTASVLMAKVGKGFEPSDPSVRQTEMLRLALRHGRSILTDAGLSHLLAEPQLNPMTAIFAAHLLLKTPLGRQQMARLAEKVPAEHPDIRAALLDPQFGRSNAVPAAFATPPMLHASWQLVMQALGKEKASVPPGSLSDRIKDGVLSTPLWLVRRLNGATGS